jgi:hypothetical protein
MSADNVAPISREGASRSGQLVIGAHGPVTIGVELMAQHSLETYYHVKVDHPGQVGAYVTYRGHKDDLIAESITTAEVLASTPYGHLVYGDERRSILVVESKAGPGKRGWIEVDHITGDRAFAESLPGVRELFPEGLPRTGPPDRDGLIAWLSRRPQLRLVVDNTKAHR